MDDAAFDDWFSEQCSIDAAELVGPNSPEYEALCERLEEDETRREAARIRYKRENDRGPTYRIADTRYAVRTVSGDAINLGDSG